MPAERTKAAFMVGFAAGALAAPIVMKRNPKTPEQRALAARESQRRRRIREGYKILRHTITAPTSPRPWMQKITGADEEWLVALVKRNPELPIPEIRRRLGERGVTCSPGVVWRTLRRNGVMKRALALQHRLARDGLAEPRS